MAGRTLRTRLIAGVLVLLAVSCVGIGIITSITLRGFLVDRLDQNLASAGSRLDVSLEHPGGAPDNGGPSPSVGDPGVEGQAVGTLAVRIANGSVAQAVVVHDTAGQVGLSNVALTPADRSALLRVTPDGRSTTTQLSSLADYRLRGTRRQDGDIHITGLPVGEVDSTVHRLEATELLVFVAALLLTGLAGAGWVRLSLRPLHRVTATAREVTSLSLGSGAVDLPHRVPQTDPRTEVGQLGAAFNQMLGHVETALDQREASEARLRRFVADASHELRTPLAGVRSYAELALRIAEDVPSEVSPSLCACQSEAVRIIRPGRNLILLHRPTLARPRALAPAPAVAPGGAVIASTSNSFVVDSFPRVSRRRARSPRAGSLWVELLLLRQQPAWIPVRRSCSVSHSRERPTFRAAGTNSPAPSMLFPPSSLLASAVWMQAPQQAASPMCSYVVVHARSWQSTLVTAKSRGRCAPTNAATSSSAPTFARLPLKTSEGRSIS